MSKAATVTYINPAIQRAQYLRASAIVLDTETTGSNRTNDEVIELGAVRASDGFVLIDQRFRPSKQIEKGAYRTHGISDRELRNEPRFDSRWPEFRALLNGAVVVGWNVAYDRQMLEATCNKYSLEMPAVEWVDLMPLYRDFRRAEKNCKLSDACAELGVRAGDHSAKADALAAARVLFKMAGTETEKAAESSRPVEVVRDQLFEPTVTHEWEVSEVQDWYGEIEEEEEVIDDESPTAAIPLTAQTGTASAYLRPDGSVCIPTDSLPRFKHWTGGQALWATLAELNAPLASWRMYAARQPLTNTCNGCAKPVSTSADFVFCVACGFYREVTTEAA